MRWVVLTAIFMTWSGLAQADALFTHMLGHWNGSGVRVDLISGRQVQIREDVTTTLELVGGEPAVLSRDQVTQITPGTPPSSYLTEYWVRAKPGQPAVQPTDQPRSYELGIPDSQAQAPTPSASGVLGSDGVFRVDQDLGHGYVVHSETRFETDETLYTETFTSGTQVQSRAEVHFTRSTQSVIPQNR